MSKGYDRVEQEFLKLVLGKVGFGLRWVHLIMEYVLLVSYSILINGEP